MERIKLTIIQLGESRYIDEWKFIEKLKSKNKSKIYEIADILKAKLPRKNNDTSVYLDSEIRKYVTHSESSNVTLCFMDYPLEDDYFMRCLDEHINVATFYETNKIFKEANIDLKNFILLKIYDSVILFLFNSIKAVEPINFDYHDETRGCLFDFCDIKEHIILKASKAKLCKNCEVNLENITLPYDFTDLLKREIMQIKKSLYYRIIDWIKNHPIFSIIITAGFSLLLNIIASIIYDIIKQYI